MSQDFCDCVLHDLTYFGSLIDHTANSRNLSRPEPLSLIMTYFHNDDIYNNIFSTEFLLF